MVKYHVLRAEVPSMELYALLGTHVTVVNTRHGHQPPIGTDCVLQSLCELRHWVILVIIMMMLSASCTGDFYLNGTVCTAWDTCDSMNTRQTTPIGTDCVLPKCAHVRTEMVPRAEACDNHDDASVLHVMEVLPIMMHALLGRYVLLVTIK